MSIVTRFAPSPTGYLHIGGARTALFNWCFTKAVGGTFLLRIEDTDRERSTDESVKAILDGLNWLGIEHDGEATYQFARSPRHAEVARDLVAQGKAYYCYCTPQELEAMKAEAVARGEQPRYNRMWRDRDPATAPEGVKPVIRIKAPLDGETTITDKVQGAVTVANAQLDDFILLRSDGTPTYMHAVVVDDHDMGVTHVIRGDDHLNNTFRQKVIFDACGWDVPTFAHLPLIHGPDGAKLSKRHGALSVFEYASLGYLPEAMCNYLLRLGWSHGDDEIFTKEEAAQWFRLEDINKAPARLDFKKLDHVNAHYIKQADNERLTDEVMQRLGADAPYRRLVLAGMEDLKQRPSTLVQLAQEAAFYTKADPAYDDKAKETLKDSSAQLAALKQALAGLDDFTASGIEALCRTLAEQQFDNKLGKVVMPLRAALTGATTSPPIFKVAEIFGKEEVQRRLSII